MLKSYISVFFISILLCCGTSPQAPVADVDADENVDRPDIAVIFSADPSTVEKFAISGFEVSCVTKTFPNASTCKTESNVEPGDGAI